LVLGFIGAVIGVVLGYITLGIIIATTVVWMAALMFGSFSS